MVGQAPPQVGWTFLEACVKRGYWAVVRRLGPYISLEASGDYAG